MPTPTYVPIAATTLAAATGSVVFAVPSGYKDLVLVYDCGVSATNNVRFIINGDSTQSNYWYVSMTGASTGVASAAFNFDDPFPFEASKRNMGTNFYFDVDSTNKHKPVICRIGVNGEVVRAAALRWGSNNAVSSVELRCGGSNTFTIGSTFNLFGIAG